MEELTQEQIIALLDSTITLPIKEKHLMVIIATISQNAANSVFKLLNEAKIKSENVTSEEDVVNVDISIQDLFTVISLMGSQQEQMYTEVNRETKNTLISVVQTLAQSTDPQEQAQAGVLMQRLTMISDSIDMFRQNKAQEGRTILGM